MECFRSGKISTTRVVLEPYATAKAAYEALSGKNISDLKPGEITIPVSTHRELRDATEFRKDTRPENKIPRIIQPRPNSGILAERWNDENIPYWRHSEKHATLLLAADEPVVVTPFMFGKNQVSSSFRHFVVDQCSYNQIIIMEHRGEPTECHGIYSIGGNGFHRFVVGSVPITNPNMVGPGHLCFRMQLGLDGSFIVRDLAIFEPNRWPQLGKMNEKRPKFPQQFEFLTNTLGEINIDVSGATFEKDADVYFFNEEAIKHGWY